ncbi:MAG: 2-C-methyl-D-erythritol 4-phosphate cytidylyltransferase [Muribaculaceae bacterium]|nr:2-C-methyl-D-erythritol 4-phosphate cytidylyltransferase [Muribaculaceae bacterium]
MEQVKVIIVAAGTGSRFGADCPKQYCMMNGRPVLMTTIDSFRAALPDAEIIVVISENMQEFWERLCKQHEFISPRIVFGGATRWESVRKGLSSLWPTHPDAIVLVHDGARPLVPSEMIERVVDGAKISDGAVPVIPVTDSLRKVTPDGSESVERSLFRAVQTPQGFRCSKLWSAYAFPYSPLFTDDASVIEYAGCKNIKLVDGDRRAMKITHPLDIKIVEAML